MQQNSLTQKVLDNVTPTNLIIAGGGMLAGLIAAGCDLTTVLLLGAAGYVGVKYYDQIKKTAIRLDEKEAS